MYLSLKYVHLGLAMISIAGFILRGFWMMKGSLLLDHKAARMAPHVVDTLFLASGIALVVQLSRIPQRRVTVFQLGRYEF